MTEEKVKQGEALLKKIAWLEDQKRRWEIGQEIRSLEVCDKDNYGHVNKVLQVDRDFINFQDLRLLALARIERRLKEVQTEFDNL